MKKIILFAILLTLVAFVTSAMAQQKPAKPEAPAAPKMEKPKAEKMEKFSGTIEKVDEMAKAIDVKGKMKKEEKTLTFATDDTTKITRGGKDIPMGDLKKGMQVSVEYKMVGEKMIAGRIAAAAPKAVKTAPKKEKTEKPAEGK